MKRHFTALRRATLILSAGALLVLGVACGGDSESDAKDSAQSAPAAMVSEDGNFLMVAKDNVFDPKTFGARANQQVTLKLDNKGAALHNFVFTDQKGADGKEIQTKLLPGGQSDTITFTLPSGMYDFFCSVHPAEMRGKLTVTE